MKNYKELLEEELDKGICWCCQKCFNKLHVHHINGNHLYDHTNNLICVCGSCHTYIHKGFKKKVKISEEIIERILILRKKLIKEKYGKDIDNFLKYEMAIASKISFNNHKKCYSCGSLKQVKLIPPEFVLKFDPKNTHKIGIPLCFKCRQ